MGDERASDEPAVGRRPAWHSRERLGRLVDDGAEDPAGRRFAVAVQAAILLSVAVFTVETLPGLPRGALRALLWVEAALVLLFTAEYALRAYAARPTRSYVFSFFGVVDLLSILPFYLGVTGVSTLRLLRCFRLFRIFKLSRYSRATRRLLRALQLAREELGLFAMLACVVTYLAAVGIYYFEHEAQPGKFASVPHSLWWAVVTLTTVGYGDVTPVTLGGRLFTGLVLLTALGVVSIPSGILASSLVEVRHEEEEAEAEADEAATGSGRRSGAGGGRPR